MRLIKLMLLGMVIMALGGEALAVPSFARQTGMACEACHTSYPELTAFGRYFKINGYTMTGITQVESSGSDTTPGLRIDQIPPLSVMLQTAYEIQRGTQPDANTTPPGSSQTSRTSAEFPMQLSLFFAGEISPKMGSMIQLTYDDQSGSGFGIDNSDIRFADHTTIGGADTIYGITLNNSPTVEDPWQSTPVWGFPFLGAAVMPSPAASAQLDGALAQDVVGLGAYALWNESVYGNVTAYRSDHIGTAQPYDSTATNTVSSTAPYWRLAWQHFFGASQLEVGTFGMDVHKIPTGVVGPSDDYLDTAVDAQYEYPFSNGNVLTVRAAMIHEQEKPVASLAAGSVANDTLSLNTWHVNGSYHIGGKQTITLGYNTITGTADTTLYAPAPVTGSANGSPNSTWWQAQYAVMPWQNVQLGLQYTAYTKFNGGSSNYDGSGTNAASNDTAMLYAWFMW